MSIDPTTANWHQLEVLLATANTRLRDAAPGSLTEARRLAKRDRIVAALKARGLTYQRAIDGGYMVGSPADFQPVTR